MNIRSLISYYIDFNDSTIALVVKTLIYFENLVDVGDQSSLLSVVSCATELYSVQTLTVHVFNITVTWYDAFRCGRRCYSWRCIFLLAVVDLLLVVCGVRETEPGQGHVPSLLHYAPVHLCQHKNKFILRT